MRKRGISAIIAVVLIILVVAAAVGIIWSALIPLIKSKMDFKVVELNVISSEGYTSYDPVKQVLSVQVRRGTDNYEINRVRIVFLFEGESESIFLPAPLPNQMVTYSFDLEGWTIIPEYVQVAPMFQDGASEEEGLLSSKVEVPEKNIINIPNNMLFLGCDEIELSCVDGKDNDCNGLIDWDDPRCNLDLTIDVNGVYHMSFDDNFDDDIGGLTGHNRGNAIQDYGLFAGSLILDGNGDYVSYGNKPSDLFDSGQFSIALWFKKDPTETDGILVSYADKQGGNADDLFRGKLQNNLINLSIFEGPAANFAAGTTPIGDGWYHVVYAYDLQDITIYLNGTLEKSIPSTNDIPDENGLSFVLGCLKSNDGCVMDEDAFHGMIDEVIIFDDFLTPEEVTKVFNREYVFTDSFNWIA